MNFSEILNQFSSKHKLYVVLIFLIYGATIGLGGKYIDSLNRRSDTTKIDSVRTELEKNCELQKQSLLATQQVMQKQINDILKDLVDLRTQLAHGYLDTYKPTKLQNIDSQTYTYKPVTDSFVVSMPIVVEEKKVTPKTKTNTFTKCIKKVDSIIDKAEKIK